MQSKMYQILARRMSCANGSGPKWPARCQAPRNPSPSAVLCSRGDERSAKLHLRRHLFFTANLAERRLRLLVDDIASAKDDGFRCRSTHPTVLAKAIGLNEVKPITYWVGCAGVLTHSSWTDFLSASHSAGRSRSERRLESLSKRWLMPTTL
jgi:hypothetical protein